MRLKGKQKLFYGLLLAILLVLLLAGLFVRSYRNHVSRLVDYTFDAETGVIAFTIDDAYEIFSLQSQNGYLSVPEFDENTRRIPVSSWEIPTCKNEFLHFIIQSQSNPVRQYHFKYEINHGDAVTPLFVEAFDYPFSGGRTDRQYFDCECPLHK